MAGLAIQYSKEVARELTEIAVVRPGKPVEIGDIIHFPQGKTGTWFFKKAAPRGSFDVVSSLSELGIDFDLGPEDKSPDPFQFVSRKGVSAEFDANAEGDLGAGVGAKGNLSVSFSREGATYFNAVGCTTRSLSDYQQLNLDLNGKRGHIAWEDTFIVTSVTTAERALIMQSKSAGGEMRASVEVDGLPAGSVPEIGADANIKVTYEKNAAFVVKWAENVTVFMGLQKFAKQRSAVEISDRILGVSERPISDLRGIAGALVNRESDVYALEPVLASDILDDSDELD